jgi:hypothetical protein
MNIRAVSTGIFLLGLTTSQAYVSKRGTRRFLQIHSSDHSANPLYTRKPSHDIVKDQDESGDYKEDDSPLGSLDSVLENARKRQSMNFWQYKLQAAWDSPLLKLDKPYPNLKSSVVISFGDLGLILIALCIDARGFALGYLIAKLTAGPFREILRPSPSVQIILLPLWPVLWAIGLDQIL